MKNKTVANALILFAITLFAGFGLGFVNDLTYEPIEKNRAEQLVKANRAVFPAAESFDTNATLEAAVKNYETILKSSQSSYGKVIIHEALEAKDSAGNVLGYLISSTSSEGYGGDITIVLGIDTAGKVIGIEFTAINETVGFGAEAANPGFKNQFSDKNVKEFKWTKGDITADNEIKAVSGATKTTRAVTNAVNAAVYFADYALLN